RCDAESAAPGFHRQEPLAGTTGSVGWHSLSAPSCKNPGRRILPAVFFMLRDLDQLMSARGIGAVIVPMHEQLHASFRWLTRGAKVTRGYAVKLIDREPLLVSYPMERDEAAATGLETRLASEFGSEQMFRDAPNSAAAYAQLYDAILSDLNAEGSIAFFGNLPFQLYHGVASELEARGRVVHRSNGEDLI